MPKKIVGYFLLSFVSFCFFSGIFLIFANTQASAQQPELQSPIVAEPTQPIPTPTIYMDNLQQLTIQQAKQSTAPSPTPTIYMTQQNTTKASISTVQPTSTPTITLPSPTLIPPTATPSPTQAPTPQPTIAATTTDLGTLFNQYASQYNVSADELRKIAGCESGFNTLSDTGLYAGMFQFSAGTWASVRNLMGLDPNPDLRKNAEEAIKTTAFMLSKGEESAWPNCH